MLSFSDIMKRQRMRSREESAETRARFKEILRIVRSHKLDSGLTPEKAVNLLQDLGTTFVKLGQIASTHPDVLPPEYCEAFGALRTKVTPLPFEEVKAQVEQELGGPIDEIFGYFEEEPVGSASVAQVHRAQLPAGEEVAVKVQRPGVVEKVTEDLAIMERMVELYEMVDRGASGLSVKDLVAEMVRTSREELDFTNEASNLERFWANNEEREGVTSPKCYRDFTTTAILTEDFAESPCVEDIESMDLSADERERLAYLVAQNYMQQIMEDGFYHADPHAGNVLVLPDNEGIEWIDFGMMGTITRSQRDLLQELMLTMAKGDAYGLKRVLLKIATPTGPVDHPALLEMCENLTEQFIEVDLADFNTGKLMGALTESLQQNGFDIDPFLMNLGRGLVTLEGTIHLISPQLNIMQVITEYLRSGFDFARIQQKARRMAGQAIESAEAMAQLPTKAVQTLDMVQKGHAKIGMEISGNEKFTGDLQRAIAILSLALIAAAFIIGFCILSASDASTQVSGLSIAGGVGLICGVTIAIAVVIKSFPFLK